MSWMYSRPQRICDLAAQVEHVLSVQAEAFSRDTRVTGPPDWAAGDDSRGVWPRLEVTERAGTDSKGRLKTHRNWHLVLHNTTGGVARNVHYRYEDAQGQPNETFDQGGRESNTIELLAPDGEYRFPVFRSLGSSPSGVCVVTWEDGQGNTKHPPRSVNYLGNSLLLDMPLSGPANHLVGA